MRHEPVHAAFFYDMSNRVEHQNGTNWSLKSGRLVFFVINLAFGRHRHWLGPRRRGRRWRSREKEKKKKKRRRRREEVVLLFVFFLFFLVLISFFVWVDHQNWNQTATFQSPVGFVLVFNSMNRVGKKRGVNLFMPHWFIWCVSQSTCFSAFDVTF